jgi:hypothetical protein
MARMDEKRDKLTGSVAVFKWPSIDTLKKDDDDSNLALSFPAAEAVLDFLVQRRWKTNVIKPYDGEGGWDFTIEVGRETFNVFTSWVPIENQDWIAIQPGLARGCLAALFLPRVKEDRLIPVVSVLDEALREIPSVSQLQWLWDDEFGRVVTRGAPLPQRPNV